MTKKRLLKEQKIHGKPRSEKNQKWVDGGLQNLPEDDPSKVLANNLADFVRSEAKELGMKSRAFRSDKTYVKCYLTKVSKDYPYHAEWPTYAEIIAVLEKALDGSIYYELRFWVNYNHSTDWGPDTYPDEEELNRWGAKFRAEIGPSPHPMVYWRGTTFEEFKEDWDDMLAHEFADYVDPM